jgi:hypothetical protein
MMDSTAVELFSYKYQNLINQNKWLMEQNQQLLHELAKPHLLNSNPSIVISDPKGYVAALLAAGNAMEERLMSLRALSNEADMRGNAEGYINASTLFTQDDADALAAWEQVTK